jgi:hypothetical protein
MDQRPGTKLLDFRTPLEKLFQKGMVIPDFEYKKLQLDYVIIATDRLIEVRHITSKAEYAMELSRIGRAGPVTFDKHKAIRAGTFISNAFYFLCPPRILALDELPPGYGLITYAPGTAGKLEFRREADWMQPDKYLTKSFYITLTKKLHDRLYA